MKISNLLKATAIVIAAVAVAHPCEAKVPGKAYQPGDTIELGGGIPCIVFKVSPDGLSGKAISPYVDSDKEMADIIERARNSYEKRIQKGQSTQKDLDQMMAQLEALSHMPQFIREKAKGGGHYYRTDLYDTALKEKYGNNWRIPNSTDADEIITWLNGGDGGIGTKYKFKYLKVEKYVNADETIWSNNWKRLIYPQLVRIGFYDGILVSDKPDQIGKCMQLNCYGKTKLLTNKFDPNTKAVAVIDF